MTSLVSAVGRDLAPHLKSIMGPWWFAQFDPVSEVSQAAKHSLQTAFPAQRRLDAIIMCTTEILMYLEENLNITPQSMSDKVVALDELEEMHQQVISSSLLALATFLDVLMDLKLEDNVEGMTGEAKKRMKAQLTTNSLAEKLFSAHNFFLDFLKHQNPSVRSAAYSVLRSFIKNVPHAINEGNMKALATAILGSFQEKNPACHSSMWETMLLFSKLFPNSWTTINVQKIVLSRFWNFLRNGCFGSQQVSYPALVPFLGCLPLKSIGGEKFFLEFFTSLWSGRNFLNSSHADRHAFSRSLSECFLWVMHNASRFFEGADIHQFHVTLIEKVLLKLLWCDFMPLVSLKTEDKLSLGQLGKPREGIINTSETNCPTGYIEDLGKCIINILSGIYVLNHDLLLNFCSEFQENCLNILQQSTTLEYAELVGRIIKFFTLLGQHDALKCEEWPLVQIVGPILVRSFSLIKEIDSADAIGLITTSVSLFGPRKIISELVQNESNIFGGLSVKKNGELDSGAFLDLFDQIFVPWCLQGKGPPAVARLDLLFVLLDNEFFSEQWNCIIRFAAKSEHLESRSDPENDHISILAMLMEKARVELKRRGSQSVQQQGSLPDHWYHELLDISAVSIARGIPPIESSDSRYLWSVLGGLTEDQTSFVSRDTKILVYEEIYRKLLNFMEDSTFSWTRYSHSSLVKNSDSISKVEPSKDALEMAYFALEVLNGSFFVLKTIGDRVELVSGILAVIFLLSWEYKAAEEFHDAIEGETCSKLKERMDFCASVHNFHGKINSQVYRSLSTSIRKDLASILAESMRFAIFKEDKLDTSKLASLCCLWMTEALERLCMDLTEEQKFLDQFLSKDDSWPLWVSPDIKLGKRSATVNVESVSIEGCRKNMMIEVIDKLLSEVGINTVIVGASSGVQLPSETSYSRAWLAAEMLCTWKWQGGSALSSFLPLLTAYGKSGNHSNEDILLDDVVSILLDGALVHVVSGEVCLNTVFPISIDEIRNVEEPFLRALASLVFALFKENIWGKFKAMSLFKVLVSKIFMGDQVNFSCLKILSLIMGQLIRPLSIRCSEESEKSELDCSLETLLSDNIKEWLQRTMLFPPLSSWTTGEDMEDWFHLVLSCYPVMVEGQRLKPGRDISQVEKELLLGLFRKQRDGSHTSVTSNKLPVVQILLSELITISLGYCWKELNEKDWDFVVYQLRRWTESAVVTMEEVAEKVDEVITNGCEGLEISLNKLVLLDSNLEPSIKTATNALAAFSQFVVLVELDDEEISDYACPLKADKWNFIKDKILEGVLRLFFSTGVAEAIANSHSHDAASIVSSSRLKASHFWELVALNAVRSSVYAREKAMKSIELWGLSKGAMNSLYAILFSNESIPALKRAAYLFLSTEPASKFSVINEATTTPQLDEDISDPADQSHEGNISLREEIAFMIEKLPCEILEAELLALESVNIFLAWSLLLSHLNSLPSSSSERERLVQHIKEHTSSGILDCLFHHIPLEICVAYSLKKKDTELPAALSEAATAATQAITSRSILFSVNSLWPLEQEKIASIAGAIFGLMLCTLPAYVREWFVNIRDRSMSSAIEAFTKIWCSPYLIATELSQIKKASIADEDFSISVSKSSNKVVATYTKDETGMDLVICLPASYPLRAIDVDCARSLGISEMKQRKWLLSLLSFVCNQNGALAEAIRIWKSNFDMEFKGVEECPICYSVIHTTNHSLPRLACKTCKHKYHSACLYKWFSTSHKSTCPLCQSPFRS
ncbi:E3 ubiquitin-protein ligase listerin isoform X2 [Impatiens glandulifera]|nr:E3 ubiquitin-protein ligase listerin isoform X2 [Impatiens glandulifera]